MKRFFVLILALIMAFPNVILAADYTAMSDDELYNELNQIRAEIVKRSSLTNGDTVLADADGIAVTLKESEPQLETMYDGTKRLVFNVTIVNTSTEAVGIRTDDCYLNGWKVRSSCQTGLDAGAKVKETLTIYDVDVDAELESIEELEDLKIVFLTYDANTYDTKTRDITTTLTFK